GHVPASARSTVSPPVRVRPITTRASLASHSKATNRDIKSFQSSNDQAPITNDQTSMNDQARMTQTSSAPFWTFPHLCFEFVWSLVLGHWSFIVFQPERRFTSNNSVLAYPANIRAPNASGLST